MAQPIGVYLQQLANMDIFFYVLPFLLVFALVFAVLQKLKITGQDNRGIDAIIALVVGLMSLQFDKVPLFFQSVIPNLGIGLSVILVGLILMGLFVNPRRHEGAVFTFFSIGAVVAIIVLLNSFNDYSWWTGGFWQENMSGIVIGIIVIVLIVVVINSGRSTRRAGEPSNFFVNVPNNPD